MADPRFEDFEKRISALEKALKGKKAETAVAPVEGAKSGTAKKGAK